MVVFGFLMEEAGFIPAMLALIPISAAAGREFKWMEVVPLTIGLTHRLRGRLHLGPGPAVSADQGTLGLLTWNSFNNLVFGFSVALTWQNLWFCFIGCFLGTLIGVLPGIGPLATIAMLLPITFNVPPVAALIMLAGIYYGAQYGGSTTAILVNLPGETSSVVTCLDGYQMARQGRAGPALAIAAIGSFFAGTVCTLIIALFGPPLAELALKFGAPEYFSLMLMGLVAAAVLAHGDMIKSLAMVAMGLLLGIVGTDVNSGMARYSFGIPELTDGIGFIVIAVGVFAVGEIVSNLGETEERKVFTNKVTGLMPTVQDLKASFWPIVRGTGIGAFFGVLPGTGPAIASFSSYMVEKKLAKDPSRFGKGAIEGVAGPESANNADAQCKFIPTLTLGIPASAVMALMLGALTIQGIAPGPQVMTQKPDLFWGLVASMWIGNLDAGAPEPPADRPVGEPAEGAVPAAVPCHHGVLVHRHLQREQQLVRALPHRDLRHHRLRVDEARMPAGADAARVRAGAADGREPAAGVADLARGSDGVLHAPDQPGLHDRHGADHRHHGPARGQGAAGGDQRLNAVLRSRQRRPRGAVFLSAQTKNTPAANRGARLVNASIGKYVREREAERSQKNDNFPDMDYLAKEGQLREPLRGGGAVNR